MSGRRRAIVVFGTTIVLVVIAPALLSASQIPPDGIDWAGRCIASTRGGHPPLGGGDGGRRWSPREAQTKDGTVVCVAIVVGDALTFVEALRRNAVGIGGSLNYFNGSWSPPVGTIAATVWGVVAIAVCSAFGVPSARRPRGPFAPVPTSMVIPPSRSSLVTWGV